MIFEIFNLASLLISSTRDRLSLNSFQDCSHGPCFLLIFGFLHLLSLIYHRVFLTYMSCDLFFLNKVNVLVLDKLIKSCFFEELRLSLRLKWHDTLLPWKTFLSLVLFLLSSNSNLRNDIRLDHQLIINHSSTFLICIRSSQCFRWIFSWQEIFFLWIFLMFWIG